MEQQFYCLDVVPSKPPRQSVRCIAAYRNLRSGRNHADNPRASTRSSVRLTAAKWKLRFKLPTG